MGRTSLPTFLDKHGRGLLLCFIRDTVGFRSRLIYLSSLLLSASLVLRRYPFARPPPINTTESSRFVVANTTETLLLGDLETLKLSEIPWRVRGGGGSGGAGGGRGGDGSASAAAAEKFIFDSPSAALVYHASELSIVEYGRNEVTNAKGEVDQARKGGGPGRERAHLSPAFVVWPWAMRRTPSETNCGQFASVSQAM